MLPRAVARPREDLANGAREGTEYLRNRTQQAAAEVSALVDRSKEQVSEYVERGRQAVDRGRPSGKNRRARQGHRRRTDRARGRCRGKRAAKPNKTTTENGSSS